MNSVAPATSARLSRRIAADAPRRRIGRDAHAAEERMQRDRDAGREGRRHRGRVERDDARALLPIRGTVVGNVAAAAVVAVRNREIDREDLHLQRVTRFCALDEHRAGEDVAAGAPPLRGDAGLDRFERRLDLIVRHPGALQACGAIGQECVDVDDVARGDRQHRLSRGIVPAVGDR